MFGKDKSKASDVPPPPRIPRASIPADGQSESIGGMSKPDLVNMEYSAGAAWKRPMLTRPLQILVSERDEKEEQLNKLSAEIVTLDTQIAWLMRYPQVTSVLESLMQRFGS